MAGRNLSWHALSYMTAQLAANVVGFVTSMILARAFTREQMGDYQQLMLVYTLFSGILISGLPSCLTYFYPISDEKKKPATVYLVLIMLFIMGTVLGLATFFAAPLVGGYFKNPRLGALVRNFCFFYAFTLGGAYMRRFLVATARYRFLLFWLPFDRLLMMLSFAVPALMGMGLERAVIIAVWVAGAKFAMTTLYTMAAVKPTKFIWDGALALRMFYYSVPMGLSQALGQISRQIDRLVIGRYMSTAFFATFTWAAQAFPFISEIAESVTTVMIPQLARLHNDGENAKFVALWQESIRKTAIIMLGIFALSEVLAEPLIIAVYSDKYIDSVPFFRVYQIGVIARVTMFGAILQAIGKTKQILYGAVGIIAIKAVLNVILFKLFGPYGCVVGSLVLGLVMMSYFLLYTSKQLGTSFRRVWPWSYHGRILAASVLAGCVTLPILLIPKAAIAAGLAMASQRIAGAHSIVAAVQCVIGAVVFLPVYVLMLHLFKVLKDKDWALLKDMTYGRFIGA